jgi:uncharacterized protein YjiS (DUF1127 family)
MSYRQPALALPQGKSARLRRVLAGIVFALPAAMKRRQTRVSLDAMDDYLLKDIGISRIEFDR